jgi:excisionase family DNA binding protein
LTSRHQQLGNMKAKKAVHLTPALSPERRGSEPSGEGLVPAGEQLLDSKAVGKRLKLSPRTVSEMANDGRLPAYRVGISLRFKWAEIEEHIVANCKVRAGGSTTGNSAVAARHALPTKGGGQ